MISSDRERAALESIAQRSAQLTSARTEPYGPHPDQVIEWYAPRTSGGAPLVLVHGGYFRPGIDRSHARMTAAALVDALQVPVVLAEYRRVPGSPDASVADIKAISDLLEGLAEEPAAWVGHSAGGTLVLIRAFDEVRPAVPTVALAPIADLESAVTDRLGDGAIEDWLGTRRAAKASRYAALDPARLAAKVPERLPAVLCLHGDDDATVPVSQSGESGIPHQVVRGADHFDLIDPQTQVWPVVVSVIRELTSRSSR